METLKSVSFYGYRSLKQLEKEKPLMGDPQTEDGYGILKHDYTDITDKETCAEDVEIYGNVIDMSNMKTFTQVCNLEVPIA